ncbi:hypothetical protein SSEA_SKINNY_51 [Mycobacterium phage Skinny]|uniref:Uncharacterized protein n=5 Tax=Bongovirus bongo TaxID=1983750 RepID=A0A514DJ31_9CAUD|nr:hypothetical protein PEGLEG_50 [Mycobacterium phage PegLeg]YP_009604908.1 hypothetical protein FDH95_gp050 [Mycobacterium phage Bongo]AXQ52691.1 hypothetical protein SEA_IPHANE7_50 [Mycobacterium phage IPhane7]QDH93623.1 hypothetical protein SEA_LILHOMIEP_49 [Mycobacterium phage LilhomieP]QGJ93197.1 hypothetical protein SEA_TYDAWG_50 [Mycobacterium phage TyDawg]UXE05254.1 hypothetical protein SSEA_SKINNY_51 [Mycobacterium phage Skinny]WMI33231.1 hypothetical protein SEA_SLIMJIMMY_49 [Mycob
MKNEFGQDITIGSVVGLGIRSGNGSEQRVGIVLELFESTPRYGKHEWKAKCAWLMPRHKYDRERGTWVDKIMISTQKFRFFLLDEASLDPQILQQLDDAYTTYMLDTKQASEFIPS